MSLLRSAAKRTIRCLPEPVSRALLRAGIRMLPSAERAILAAAYHVPCGSPLITTTADGFAMELHLDDGIDRRVYYTGHYEAPTEALFRKLLPGAKCFVDIGANNGFFAILAATQMNDAGRVFAFEPFPATYSRLQRNVQVAGVRSVEALNIALSNATERRSMFARPGALGYTTFAGQENIANRAAAANVSATIDESVECDTFDRVWAKYGEGKVDLVKMDIEGAELLVLEGMPQALRDRLFTHLFLEVHPRQIRELGGEPHRVAELLMQRGYRLLERRDGRLDDLDAEAFFASDVGHRFILATQDESLRGLVLPSGF
jgi:FkbM family methyltransferase